MSVVDPAPDARRDATMPLRLGLDPAFRPRPQIARGDHVLYAGRLSREKGLRELLDAAAASTEPWTLQLVGTGPAEDMLRHRVRQLGIGDRVRFTPYLTDRVELARCFARARCVVLPGPHETFGLAALEAAACAAPVVTAAETPSAALHRRAVRDVPGRRRRRPAPGARARPAASGRSRRRLAARLAATAGMPRSRPSSPTCRSCSGDDPRLLAVAVHDVEPRSFARVRDIRDWLLERGVEPGDAARHPSPRPAPDRSTGPGARRLAARPRRLRRRRRPARPRPSGGAVIRAVATPDARELAGRQRRGVPRPRTPTTRCGVCRPAGGCSRRSSSIPRGFVAPGYAYTRALRGVLGASFDWFADIALRAHAVPTGSAPPALCLGSSTPLKRALSPPLVRAAGRTSGTADADRHPPGRLRSPRPRRDARVAA